MIKNSVRSVLITSGEIGSIFIPSLYCGIKPLNNLLSCIIYAEYAKLDIKSAKWTSEYPIVKSVIHKQEDLLEQAIRLTNDAIAFNETSKK